MTDIVTITSGSNELDVVYQSRTIAVVYGGAPGFKGDPGISPKALTLLDPLINDFVVIYQNDNDITMTEIKTAVVGDSSPIVTATFKYGPNVSGANSTVIASNVITSNTTSGNVLTTFTTSNIPANNWIWVELNNVTGETSIYTAKLSFTIN